jgi:small-conductance mechanosensitive channel
MLLVGEILVVGAGAVMAADQGDTIKPPPASASDAPSFVQETLIRLWGQFIAYLPLLIVALIIVLLTWLSVKVLSKIARRTLARSSMRRSLQALFLRFIRFGAWSMGLLIAAIVLFPNLTPTRALSGLGLASIAAGLIFKEFFENFFAGILILWRFPMDIGDFIECKEIIGRIEDISVRMTLIRQVSDELVLVPNSYLTSNPVKVLTNLSKRRVMVVLNVGYEGALEDAVHLIHAAAKNCETVDKSHRIEVFPCSLSPNSIDVELAWWTGPTPLDVRRSRGEVLTAVKRTLEEAGIEMPTPYRTVVFKNRLEVDTQLSGKGGAFKAPDHGSRELESKPHQRE